MPTVEQSKTETGEYYCQVCKYKTQKKQLYQTHLSSKKHKKNSADSLSSGNVQAKSKSKPVQMNHRTSSSDSQMAADNLEKLNLLAQQLSQVTRSGNNSNSGDDPFGESFAKQFSNPAFKNMGTPNSTGGRNMDIELNLTGPPVQPGSGFEAELTRQIKEQMDKYNPNPNFEGCLPEEEEPYQKGYSWTGMFDLDYLRIHPYQQESYDHFTDKYDFLPSKIRDAIFQDVKILLAFNTLYNQPEYFV